MNLVWFYFYQVLILIVPLFLYTLLISAPIEIWAFNKILNLKPKSSYKTILWANFYGVFILSLILFKFNHFVYQAYQLRFTEIFVYPSIIVMGFKMGFITYHFKTNKETARIPLFDVAMGVLGANILIGCLNLSLNLILLFIAEG